MYHIAQATFQPSNPKGPKRDAALCKMHPLRCLLHTDRTFREEFFCDAQSIVYIILTHFSEAFSLQRFGMEYEAHKQGHMGTDSALA